MEEKDRAGSREEDGGEEEGQEDEVRSQIQT